MLRGDRIRLRALEHEDLPQFAHWLSDEQVIRGLRTNVPYSLAQAEEEFKEALERKPKGRPLVIEVPEGDAWKSIGGTHFDHMEEVARSAEVVIMIGDKAYWNQGYARETLRVMLNHGFADLNLERVYLDVLADHERAIRAYHHAGFVEEGRLRRAAYREGKYIDVILMSVLRSEWESWRQPA